MSDLKVGQIVHEDIQYFSFKMRKDRFLSQAVKDSIVKLFNNLKHPLQLNMPWFFSDDPKFYQDQMINS